jgi:phosphoribosylanthranilate isomerase
MIIPVSISEDQAAAKAFDTQTTMKTILKMTKEEMKREIASKTPTFERLQQHGPMPTKTIDQIRGQGTVGLWTLRQISKTSHHLYADIGQT